MLNYNLQCPASIRAHLRGRPAPYQAVLQALQLPTLVIHGELDPINLPAMATYTVSCIPTAHSRLYPGVAHMPFWEASQRFNTDLAQFIDANA